MKKIKSHIKEIIVVAVTIIAVSYMLLLNSLDYNGYVVYSEDRAVAYVKDKFCVDDAYNSLKEETAFKEIQLEEYFRFEKGKIDIDKFFTEEQLKNMLSNYIVVDAYAMKSDEKLIGFVKNNKAGDEALKKVKDKYIDTAKLEDIESIDTNNNISYEKVKCNLSSVMTSEQIANNIIYHNNNEEKLITFTITKIEKAKPVINLDYEDSTVAFLEKQLYVPANGVITSYFGERWGTIHKGLDIAANENTPIKAAFNGKVTFSGVLNGYGNVIILSHDNDVETLYAHCNKLYANEGESISKGQHIADIGNTGNSTGPHLHFEIRVNGEAVDPLKYIMEK
ncbi:M23 family metallopeptidase [Clostridium sp. Marseille-QA1073]